MKLEVGKTYENFLGNHVIIIKELNDESLFRFVGVVTLEDFSEYLARFDETGVIGWNAKSDTKLNINLYRHFADRELVLVSDDEKIWHPREFMCNCPGGYLTWYASEPFNPKGNEYDRYYINSYIKKYNLKTKFIYLEKVIVSNDMINWKVVELDGFTSEGLPVSLYHNTVYKYIKKFV